MKNNNPHLAFSMFFSSDENVKRAAYAISKSLANGHICLDLELHNSQLKNSEDELLEEINIASLKNSVKYVSFNPGLDSIIKTPFVLEKRLLYLQRYWYYEINIFLQLKRKSNLDGHNLKDILPLKNYFLNNMNIDSTINWQLIAALNSLLHKLSFITGGPGTGKTTTVAKILGAFYQLNFKYKTVLVAPTGKAAMRLKESLMSAIYSENNGLKVENEVLIQLNKIDFMTLHSLLGWQPFTHRFKSNINNQLSYDIVIIDEASMIDCSLFSKLLEAISDSTYLIFLGDSNQLSSVDAGSILGDICQLKEIVSKDVIKIYEYYNKEKIKFRESENNNFLSNRIVSLKKSYRFQSNNGIGQLSHAILHNNYEYLNKLLDSNLDNNIILLNDSSSFRKYFDHFRSYINEKDPDKALKSFAEFRILTPFNNGPHGVGELNMAIEKYLKINMHNKKFYKNQPLIITKNDPQNNLYNGDIGIVREYMGKLYLFLSDNRKINVFFLNHYQLAFAMTIHKSQGSEFKKVLIILNDVEQGNSFISRELLYTAVTRAREMVYLSINKLEILKVIIGTSIQRTSGLLDRIKNNLI